MQLDKWQQEILDYSGDFLLCTGRQVGKTTIMAIKSAEYMIANPKSNIIIVSITEDQAELLILMLLDYLEKKDKKLIAKGKFKPTKTRVALKNGSMALARPVGNTGDAVRGFTGNVLIIDEASRMPEIMFMAAKPTLLTTGGQIWICSTPKGKQGYFYESYLNRSGRFKIWEINSEDVVYNRPISESWNEQKRKKAIEFLENEKKDMSNLEYGQEYLGMFVEDLSRLISDEIIAKSCVLSPREQIIANREYYLGLDIARLGDDETTFEGLDKINNKNIEQFQHIITRKQYLTQTSDKILEFDKFYNYKKIGIDTTGVGAGVFDILLREESTRRKIVSIENAKRSIEYDPEKDKGKKLLKEDIWMNFLALLEKGYLKLLNNADVMMSLQSLQYEYAKKENEQTRLRIFGDNTHIAQGLAIAAWLAKGKNLSIWIKSF